VSKYVRLAVSLGLLGWVAWRTDWEQVGQAFGQLRAGWWLAAAGTLVLAQLASAARWRLLAMPLGFRRGYSSMAGFYFIGMYFNLVLPTSVGGDVVRAWYLDGRSGRRLPAFLSVFLDRLSGLAVLLALAVLGVLLSPRPLPAWVHLSVWGAAGAAVLGLVLLPLVARLRVGASRRARTVLDGLAAVRSPRLLVSSTLLSAVVQAANVVLVWMVGQAIAAPVPGSYYWVLVPMVSLLTLLPSINGVGVREQAMVLFLAPLGVGEGTALTLSFLWFAVGVAVSLAGGLVYLFGRFPAPPADEAADPGRGTHGPVDHHPDQGRARQLKAAA
jgi:uncharacterized membrane protein YbhN (UPF0104 family)